MNRCRSTATTFKPELETLEGRMLLSDAGSASLLPVVVQAIQQEVTQLNAQTAQLTQDFNKLTADVAASGPIEVKPASPQVFTDYSTVMGELNGVLALGTAIQSQITLTLNYESLLISRGSLNLNNQQDAATAVNAYDSLVFGSFQAYQDVNTALGIAATAPGNQYPSIDEYINELYHAG